MIKKKAFARAYAKHCGISYQYALADCEKFWEVLGKLLYEDKENVLIEDLGLFKQKTTAPKNFKHPVTGEMKTRPARKTIKFTPKRAHND